MVQGLQELLRLTFKPEPRPKTPPKRLYRVGWWKPTLNEYAKIRHTYTRFETEDEAAAFAAEQGGAVRAERWTPGQWRTIPSQSDLDRRARFLAEYEERQRQNERTS